MRQRRQKPRSCLGRTGGCWRRGHEVGINHPLLPFLAGFQLALRLGSPLGHVKKMDRKREEWMSPAALTSFKHLETSPGSHRSTAIRGTALLGNKGAEMPLAQSEMPDCNMSPGLTCAGVTGVPGKHTLIPSVWGDLCEAAFLRSFQLMSMPLTGGGPHFEDQGWPVGRSPGMAVLETELSSPPSPRVTHSAVERPIHPR